MPIGQGYLGFLRLQSSILRQHFKLMTLATNSRESHFQLQMMDKGFSTESKQIMAFKRGIEAAREKS